MPERMLFHGRSALAVVIVCSSSLLSFGAATTFFGEDINTTDPCIPADDPDRPSSFPDSMRAYNEFISALTGPQTETFERYPTGNAPQEILYGSIVVTIAGTLSVQNVPERTLDGTYPISGNQFLLQFGEAGSFRVTFDSPQTAFGFFATDVGDGGANLIVELEDEVQGVERLTLDHATSEPFTCPNISGSILFFGVVREGLPFTNVTFTNTNATLDGFGFDDMTIGSTGTCSSPAPGIATGLMLEIDEGGSLHLTWTDAPNADDHVVFVADHADDLFNAVAGTAGSGAVGLTVPMPEGDKFYLVAGSSVECGVGPKR